jgi:hypothetical protein
MVFKTMHRATNSAQLIHISQERFQAMIDGLDIPLADKAELLHAVDCAIADWEHVGFLLELLYKRLSYSDADTEKIVVPVIDESEVG